MNAPSIASSRVGVPFARDLADFGDAAALVAAGATITYAELADRVRARLDLLGETRRLVLLTGSNQVETLVTYIAALAGGHPVLLMPGDNPTHLASVVERYDPDVVAESCAESWSIDVRRDGTAHDLHPDLAVLLSTSGSTGSPKLVRLSADNLQSNAEAIADYLDIQPTDRAATTLPLHYCYGLSVVNSHLARGASLALTDLSVVDACFWDLVRTDRVTTFAGVPYTFELLERVGFDRMRLPHLRYVTQAGGRMSPERVRRFAELGRRNGWDLVVMYGQTEATARMGYLPPQDALTRPTAVGVAIPGGSFRVDAQTEGDDIGELVYSGPNVMLGYAESAADLRLGRTTSELRTGDLARIAPDGMVEIVGRCNRACKVVGLRIDLDRVERLLADEGVTAACAEAELRLLVAAEVFDTAPVRDLVRRLTGLPSWAVVVVGVPALPRTPSGKPCYAAVAGMAPPAKAPPTPAGVAGLAAATAAEPAESSGGGRRSSATLRDLYAELLGRDDVTDDSSFVTLEGDSLSYVEVSIRLEDLLGTLPGSWHTMTIRELAAHGRSDRGSLPGRRDAGGTSLVRRLGRFLRRRSTAVPGPSGADRSGRLGRRIESNVVLRALAIVMIVGSHANLFALAGGAHVLLGACGFNMGRFHLTGAAREERVRHLVTSVLRVALPSLALVGAFAVVTADYPLPTVLLVNEFVGPDHWAEPAWYFWFIEVIVWSLVAVTLLVAIPAVDRLERRYPFGLAMTFVGIGLLPRYGVLGLADQGDRIHSAFVVFWVFSLGWAAAKASATTQRLLVTAVAAATLPGFFDDLQRELLIVAGFAILVWLPSIRVPRIIVPVLGLLASSSLYIYLTHWQVYPWLEDRWPLLALLASLAVGVVVARLLGPLTGRVDRLLPRRRVKPYDDERAGERAAVRV